MMMEITENLSEETFKVLINGETQTLKLVPQIASSLRMDLIFWQTYPDQSSPEGKTKMKLERLLFFQKKIKRWNGNAKNYCY